MLLLSVWFHELLPTVTTAEETLGVDATPCWLLLCLHTDSCSGENPTETCEECSELFHLVPRSRSSRHVLFRTAMELNSLDYA